MTTEPFGARLARAMAAHGPLCVGIDPHAGLLAHWGLADDAGGLRAFALRVVEALAGQVAAVKPQAAFFERHGSAGIVVLEEVIAAARAAGLLCILDAKRGDIGTTMDGYAQAYLSDRSPLAADALTLSPYLGFGALQPALRTAQEYGRGVFVLALTSNPDGRGIQHARDENGVAVAATVAAEAAHRNATELSGGAPMGSVGLVVGATVGDAPRQLGLDLAAMGGPILAPGIGAQGAGGADLVRTFGTALPTVLATSSRGVLQAGPQAADLRRAAAALTAELRAITP